MVSILELSPKQLVIQVRGPHNSDCEEHCTCDVSLCSPIEVYGRFGGTNCLLLHGRRVIPENIK
jgi:hypothetical protein